MFSITDRTQIRINAKNAGIYNKHVLCAVSGGADSVALLLLLCRLRDSGDIRLSAAHYEHGIRGAESIADRDFVSALCAKLKIPLYLGAGDVPKEAARRHEGLETCARLLRRDFLETARKESEADIIALAHHKDDQAETVLMHIFRGGGQTGAGGMTANNGTICRPLLRFSKKELIDFLEGVGQDWREDKTNAEADNPRNILRLNVIPQIVSAYPNAVGAIARFSEISRAEDELLNSLAADMILRNARAYAGICELKNVNEAPVALVRRMIRLILPFLDFENVERARNAVGRETLQNGASAEKYSGSLYLSEKLTPPKGVAIADSGETRLNGVCTLVSEGRADAPIYNNGLRQALDKQALENAVLRTRNERDFIRPLGMDGSTKSLSDYLTDRKFPRPLRDRLPVIAVGSEILWAAGVGIGETAKMRDGRAAALLSIQMNTELRGMGL